MTRALPDAEGSCEGILPSVTFLPLSFALIICLPSGGKPPKWRVTFQNHSEGFRGCGMKFGFQLDPEWAKDPTL